MKKQHGFIDEAALRFIFWVFVIAFIAVTVAGWEFGKWLIAHITWSFK